MFMSKSRHVYLLPGRLVFTKMGLSDIDEGFDVPRKYSFFFHPNVQISIKDKVIFLHHRTTSFQLPWLKKSVTMNMGKSAVSLTFAVKEASVNWEKVFRKECSEPKISLQVQRNQGNYNEVLYSILMNSALSGNRSLLSFILAESSDSEPILKALHANLRDQINFKNDPNVLSCAVELSSKDVVDRCLLLFFKLPALTHDQIQSILDCDQVSIEEAEAIGHIQAAIKSLPLSGSSAASISNLAPIYMLLHSFSEDESLRKCLLKILNHPSASAESCARGALSFETPNHWSEQRQWFSEVPRKCGSNIILQNADDMKLLVYSPYWIILKLLQIVRSNCRARRIQRELFSEIPSQYFAVAFKAVDNQTGNVVHAHHFIKYFLDLSIDEFAATMREPRFRNGMSDEFFQALLEEALKINGGCNIVVEIATELLFKTKEFCENDFSAEYIEKIPNFVPFVVEELHKASGYLFTSDPDPCKLLVTFVLRLENCASRSAEFRDAYMVTLTDWLTADLEKKKERMDMVVRIFDELQIHKYVHQRLSPLMETFFPEILGAGSRSPALYLADEKQSVRRTRIYSKERMAELLLGLMVTSAVARSNSFALLLSMETNVITTFLAKDEPFREESIRLLSQHYNFSKDFLDAMNANQILNNWRHFRPDALDLMNSNLYAADTKLFAEVVTVALKLEEYHDLKNRVGKVLANLLISRDKKVPMMRKILEAINSRKQEELGLVSIEDLSLCVNHAINAIDVLGLNQEIERSKLNKLLEHTLKECSPPTWKERFKGAYSIAIFLKYLAYDDINEAYKVFSERNVENQKFLSLLDSVSKIYRAPLITNAEVDHVLNAGTTEEAIASFLNDLDARLQKHRSTNEERLIAKMGVEWMKKINRIMKVPIAPRNAQFITMLTCCKWAKEVCSNRRDTERALVAQVGTGEGKSLIIAMSAIYMVKELGKKVHILENNESLLKKDFEQFRDFYASFGIKVADGTKTNNSEFENYDVIYTLRRDLESYYRDSVFRGVPPFANTILIVDEVDELIVDDNPNQSYVKRADSSAIAAAFKALKDGDGKPDHVSMDMWQKAVAAKDTANTKRRNIDYLITSEGEIIICENSKPTHWVDLWAEYICYVECNTAPSYHTRFFYQSMPYMLLQYECILGLSGSLGSPAEKNYLKSTYGAWNYTVPSFLDTCRQMRPGIPNKHLPVLVGDTVRIFKSKVEQYQAIAELAVEMATDVPVLIIVPYTEKREMIEQVLKCIRKMDSKWLGGNAPEEFVQLFSQYDDDYKKMDWTHIVDKATAAVPRTKSRRITVTDPFGGRGHDFSVRDDHEHVEEHGGMLVIATFIPESERDWIQWKGRTARSDNKGQFAVLLRQDPLGPGDPAEQKDPAFLTAYDTGGIDSSCHSQNIIGALLGIQDKKKEEQIKKGEETISKGKRLNELCDQYYLTHKTGLAGCWPSCERDEILSSFLEGGDGSARAVQEVSRRLGLSYTSKY